jgi:hypothetical protein
VTPRPNTSQRLPCTRFTTELTKFYGVFQRSKGSDLHRLVLFELSQVNQRVVHSP